MAWKPKWWESEEPKTTTTTEDDKKLPPELESRFKTIEAQGSEITEIKSKMGQLDSVSAFIEEMRAEKQRTKEEVEARARKQAEPTDEDMAALLLTDPKKVIESVTGPQKNLLLSLNADRVRRQVFEDRETDFPYYTGEIKTEVNRIIAEQSLGFQNDPKSLENAYYTVVGRKQKEINEGKVKSRFAGSGGNIQNTTSESRDDIKFDVSPEIERAARLSGIPIEEYMKIVKKAALAGDIEYV